jgi:hypothetical protein
MSLYTTFLNGVNKSKYPNYVWVCVLDLRNESRFFSAMYCIVTSGLYSRTISSTFSHKKHDSLKNVIGLKCVLWFSLQLLSEIFFVIRRIQLNIIVNVHSRHTKYLLFLSDINEIWIFSTEMWIIFKYRISWKSVQWECGCSVRTDGRTVRHDEANSCISQFCECAWKRCIIKRRLIMRAACGPR